MSTTAVSGGEIREFLQRINSTLSTASSDFIQTMKEIAPRIKAGELSAAAAQKAIADYFYQGYQSCESAGRLAAERAATNGSTAGAQFWSQRADTWSAAAGERAILGDAAWIRGTANLDVVASLRALGGLTASGLAIAGGLIEIAQVIDVAARPRTRSSSAPNALHLECESTQFRSRRVRASSTCFR